MGIKLLKFPYKVFSHDGKALSGVPGRVAQLVGHLTLTRSGNILSFLLLRFFKKGSCQLLAKVCARSTG